MLFAVEESVQARPRNRIRLVALLTFCANLGVLHVRHFEEVGIHGTRLQRRHVYANVLQFKAQALA